jgi:hypothetical protein
MDLTTALPWADGDVPIVDCGEGWHPLILKLHNTIAEIDPDYRVEQIKEKFGGLRYYVMTSEKLSDEQRRRVFELTDWAEAESTHICEVCGAPGTLNDGPWLSTRCSLHKG